MRRRACAFYVAGDDAPRHVVATLLLTLCRRSVTLMRERASRCPVERVLMRVLIAALRATNR